MKLTQILGAVLVASVTSLSIAAAPVPAAAAQKTCAQGLIKKTKCKTVAFQSANSGDEAQQRWARGDRIPRTVVLQEIHYVDYDLPRPDSGYSYVSIGDDIYLVADTTRRVVEQVRLAK